MRERVVGTFPLMHDEKQIGSILIYSIGQHRYRYQISIANKASLTCLPPSLRFIFDKPKTAERDRLLQVLTNKWIAGRLFPPSRQNADDILKRLGLHHYDQVDILRKTKAKTVSDRFWINFDRPSGNDQEAANVIRA